MSNAATALNEDYDPNEEITRLRLELDDVRALHEQTRKRKTSILAMAVHDLRTPLAIIQGYAQLLEADLTADADPSSREYLSNILAYSEALAKMVDNLLALDQLERGELRLSSSRVNLNDLMENAIAQVEGLCGVKSLNIHYYPPIAPAWVLADEDQMYRILYNLLSHAIKYAPPAAQLTIDVEGDAAAYRLHIHDPNRYLPPDVLARLFNFAEVGKDGLAALRGMDMGLILTRQIAEQHGGRVEARSKKNNGLTMTLHLPAHKD